MAYSNIDEQVKKIANTINGKVASVSGRKQETVGDIINRVSEEYAPGDNEFKKVMHAIALAESGGDPNAEGDDGWSIGVFQNNRLGGRGMGHSVEDLKNPEYNIRLAADELVRSYYEAVRRGLVGADLVAYVSRNGQRPAEGLEWNAARNYGLYVGENEPVAVNEPSVLGTQTKKTPEIKPEFTNDEYKNFMKAYGLELGSNKTFKSPLAENELTKNFNPKERVMYEQHKKNDAIIREMEKDSGFNVGEIIKNMIVKPVYSSTQGASSQYSQGTTPIYGGGGGYSGYTVKPGDTLWGIAQRYLGSGDKWQQLGYKGDPTKLQVGTTIPIPSQSQKVAMPTPRPTPSQSSTTQTNRSNSQGTTPVYGGGGSSRAYTVKPGDTLWGIAQRYLGSGDKWQQLGGYSGKPENLPVGTNIVIG